MEPIVVQSTEQPLHREPSRDAEPVIVVLREHRARIVIADGFVHRTAVEEATTHAVLDLQPLGRWHAQSANDVSGSIDLPGVGIHEIDVGVRAQEPDHLLDGVRGVVVVVRRPRQQLAARLCKPRVQRRRQAAVDGVAEIPDARVVVGLDDASHFWP